MKAIAKQKTGFRFGKHSLNVVQEHGSIYYKGKDFERTYKLLEIKTSGGETYFALRLYNGSGKFIKQLLFEEQIAESIASLIYNATKIMEVAKCHT